MSGADHYEVLGVTPQATSEEVVAAYERQMDAALKQSALEDMAGHGSRSADREGYRSFIRQINAAIAVLGDPEARAHYDHERQAAAEPASATGWAVVAAGLASGLFAALAALRSFIVPAGSAREMIAAVGAYNLIFGLAVWACWNLSPHIGYGPLVAVGATQAAVMFATRHGRHYPYLDEARIRYCARYAPVAALFAVPVLRWVVAVAGVPYLVGRRFGPGAGVAAAVAAVAVVAARITFGAVAMALGVVVAAAVLASVVAVAIAERAVAAASTPGYGGGSYDCAGDGLCLWERINVDGTAWWRLLRAFVS